MESMCIGGLVKSFKTSTTSCYFSKIGHKVTEGDDKEWNIDGIYRPFIIAAVEG